MNVENLSFAYGEREVLRDISFSVEYGEFLSVLGPTGVGKSTLFRCMLGLLTPSSGAAVVDGLRVADLSARRLAEKIAYIPQSHNPVFNFSVYDMVLMGTTAQTGSFASPGKRQRSLANKALDRLGIFDLAGRGYGSLSGGERQLVLIARAIAQEAKVLVMDEPSAALDFGNRMRVMRTVQSLTRDGYAVIQSTHDPEQAYMYSDKILALHGGRVAAFGTPQDVMDAALVSRLYGEEVEVCSMREDAIRVCIPKNL